MLVHINRKSFENALRVLFAISGSTNALIHLTAMARRLNLLANLEICGGSLRIYLCRYLVALGILVGQGTYTTKSPRYSYYIINEDLHQSLFIACPSAIRLGPGVSSVDIQHAPFPVRLTKFPLTAKPHMCRRRTYGCLRHFQVFQRLRY